MLFVSYWKLNQDMPLGDLVKARDTLMVQKLFPARGLTVHQFVITPSHWGVTIFSADKAEDVVNAFAQWRSTYPGFFESVSVEPAMAVVEAFPLLGEALSRVQGGKEGQ